MGLALVDIMGFLDPNTKKRIPIMNRTTKAAMTPPTMAPNGTLLPLLSGTREGVTDGCGRMPLAELVASVANVLCVDVAVVCMVVTEAEAAGDGVTAAKTLPCKVRLLNISLVSTNIIV